MMMTTDANRAIEHQIHNLTTLTDEELMVLERLVERAYVHVMIERHLRQGHSVS